MQAPDVAPMEVKDDRVDARDGESQDCSRWAWTDEDVLRLVAAVERCGPSRWPSVAKTIVDLGGAAREPHACRGAVRRFSLADY